MSTLTHRVLKFLRELFVIFIGVLLALAGENYVQSRNTKTLEKGYLNSLLSELDESLFVALDDQDRLHMLDSAAWTLVNLAQGVHNTPLDSSRYQNPCELLSYINSIIEPDIYKSVYEDLKVTGNFQTISNQSLRQRIIKHYERALYEEKWCKEIRDNLAPPYKSWAIDILTAGEYFGEESCDRRRVMKSLNNQDVLNNLKKVRVVAVENGLYLQGRIESTRSLMKLINDELKGL
ncbi:MAG: hypothetical protein R2820_04835 [Cyclobacteriaceae bacterium]|nr:hypothetical protein [Cyclobacteriaceae bacterium]